jgi:hypothetical protein
LPFLLFWFCRSVLSLIIHALFFEFEFLDKILLLGSHMIKDLLRAILYGENGGLNALIDVA